MELLGTMYLYKIRYGEYFGNAAGSCWRLLFVYALMPWLHGYRVSSRPSVITNPQALSIIGPDGTSMDGRSLIELSRNVAMMMREPQRPSVDSDQIQLMENAYKDQIRQLEDENQERSKKNRRLEKVSNEQAKMISDLEREKAELEQSRADLEAILASLEVQPSSSRASATESRNSTKDIRRTLDP
jgi:hypothetical protein